MTSNDDASTPQIPAADPGVGAAPEPGFGVEGEEPSTNEAGTSDQAEEQLESRMAEERSKPSLFRTPSPDVSNSPE